MQATAQSAGEEFDLVLSGGRVMDPESGLNGLRNIGITAGRIAALSTEPLRGKRVLDVRGLVVAPGFIDIHAHGLDLESGQLQAQDGVTTALETELGTLAVARWALARSSSIHLVRDVRRFWHCSAWQRVIRLRWSPMFARWAV